LLADRACSRTGQNAADGLGEYVVIAPRTPSSTTACERTSIHSSAPRANTNRDPCPKYVEREFRKYLRCGVLANGFLRAYCTGCGADE
jgi:hypothetical protein